jgi:Ca-activated chloride channel homolog
MFRFQHSEYLMGLALLVLLVILFINLLAWKRSRAKKIGDPDLVKHLVKGYSPVRFTLKVTMALLALALIITGAANLQRPGNMENISRKGVM